MIEAIDRLTILDLAMVLIVALSVAVGVFASLWRQAQEVADRQRMLAASNFRWACEGRDEVVALRRELAQAERRNIDVLEHSAELTRHLLAKNYYEIDMNVRRRKQTE